MLRKTITAALLLLAVACGGDSSGPPALQPASFAVIEGAAQLDTVGRELKDMIAVRVIDTDGATAVPNIPITWTPLDGGQVFAAVVFSGSDGIARQRYTLGTQAGVQRVRLTALDGETGAILVDDTVTAEAVAGAVDTLFLARHDTTIFLGERLALGPLVTGGADEYGNAVANPPLIAVITGVRSDDLRATDDSLWSLSEQRAAVTFTSGSAASSVTVTTLLDLRTRAWDASWACLNGPNSMRDVEQPPIGLDSVRVSVASDSVRYVSSVGELWLRGIAARWWKDGVNDTVDVTEQLRVLKQRPDTLEMAAGDVVKTTSLGAYVGPFMCNGSDFIGRRDPLSLVAH